MTTITLWKSSLDEQIKFTLNDLSHLLVMWTTGSGKTVIRNRIIWEILLQNNYKNISLVVTDFFKEFKWIFEKSNSVKVCNTVSEFDNYLDFILRDLWQREIFLKKTEYTTLEEYNTDIEKWKYKWKPLWEMTFQEKKELDSWRYRFWEKISDTIVIIDEFQLIQNKEMINKIDEILIKWKNVGIKMIIFWQFFSEDFSNKIMSKIPNIVFTKTVLWISSVYKEKIHNIDESLYFRWYGECLCYWDIFKRSIKYPLQENIAIRWRIELLSQEELSNIVDIYNTTNSYLN